MVQIDQEKSEILVQKLEGIAKDKDLASFLGDSITRCLECVYLKADLH